MYLKGSITLAYKEQFETNLGFFAHLTFSIPIELEKDRSLNWDRKKRVLAGTTHVTQRLLSCRAWWGPGWRQHALAMT